jgi:hypothetical protein
MQAIISLKVFGKERWGMGKKEITFWQKGFAVFPIMSIF